MSSRILRPRRWFIYLLSALAGFAVFAHVHGADSQPTKRVLIISTGSRLAPGFRLVDQQLLEALAKFPSGRIETYAENLDLVRFSSERYQRLFTEYLAGKYTDNPPDLVILVFVGNLATPAKLLPQLFAGTPIIAAGLTEEEIRPDQFGGLIAGVAQRLNPGANLELILRLQPEVRRVVVIGGTAEIDRQVTQRVKDAAAPFKERLAIDFWDNRSIAELRQAVMALPRDTAILIARMFKDGAGQTVTTGQVSQWIGEWANVPVYVMIDSGIGTGAVGGAVVSIEAFSKRAGELASLVLTGSDIKSLPFEIRTDSVPLFDWRALQRWGISEGRLPPGSVVRHKPISLWQQFHWYIVGAATIFLLQAAMIAGLVRQGRRRRRAETELSESRQFMELATEAGGIGLWVRDLVQGDMWANPRVRSLLGFEPDDVIEVDKVLARINPSDRAKMMSVIERAQEKGDRFEVEFRTAIPGKPERWVTARGQFVRDPRGQVIRRMGTMIDITERKRTEQALSESEERFRTVANAAPVMIWMSGTEKLCIFFNKGWLDFTGRTLEQELGNGWSEGVHRDDFERCLEIYTSCFGARQEFSMEYRLRRYDGEYRWVMDRGVPRFDSDGSFLGYIGTATDITELRRGEEKFRLAVEASANAIVMVNGQGQIVLVNQQTEKLFGYSRDELIGQSVEILVPERFRGDHAGYRAAFTAAPQARSMGAGRDLYARRKDGSEVRVEIGLNPIRTEQGLLVLTSIVDISERKKSEEALEKERAFLRQVIDIDPNFIFAKDREGRFTLANRAVAEAYGTTVEDLIGKTDADFNPHAEEVQSFHRMDLEVIDTLQERFIPEEPITDAKGKVRWLQTVKRPIIEKDGFANQVLGASTDITSRKATETELQRNRDELAHMTRVSTLGELAASLAHELNQPLTGILSNAQAAQRFLSLNPADLDEVREILKDIVDDDNRAAEVIQKLRALYKKEALAFAALDLPSVIDDVVQLVHSDAVLHNVRIALDADADLPPARGDKVQLQQVVLNLLRNAIDAMKDCPINDREMLVRAQRQDGGFLRVAVGDRGRGLTADKLDKIFQPFYTTKRDGLGMGLSVSRSIIEAHGGQLWAEINADRGATFYFTVGVEKGRLE